MSIPNFNANIPQPTDLISDSQNDLLNNNKSLDGIFGIDHYPFSNTTQNKGFHNTVTTPLIMGSAHPTTTTNDIFYAMNDLTAIGLLQYSRGTSNAVPSPVTFMQAPSGGTTIAAGGGTLNILDFQGLSFAIARFTGYGRFSVSHQFAMGTCDCYFSTDFDTTLSLFNVSTSTITLKIQVVTGSGANQTLLQIKNNDGVQTVTNFRWSLQFFRIQK